MSTDHVGFIALTLRDFRVSRRVRLADFASPTETAILFDLRFASSDDSIYLIPHLTQPYFFAGFHPDGRRFAAEVRPNSGFHLSFHSSGIVQVGAGASSHRIYSDPAESPPTGRLVRIAANSTAHFRRVAHSAVSSTSRKTYVLPGMAPKPIGTVGLDLFRHPVGAAWERPVVADMVLVDVAVQPRGRPWEYHLLSWWSTTQLNREIAISFTR